MKKIKKFHLKYYELAANSTEEGNYCYKRFLDGFINLLKLHVNLFLNEKYSKQW